MKILVATVVKKMTVFFHCPICSLTGDTQIFVDKRKPEKKNRVFENCIHKN